jgi:cholesterol transport system auxiliary component
VALMLLVTIPLFAGCFKRSAPTSIERYAFEYTSPEFSGRDRIEHAIKIERFSAAKAFNTLSMVFRPEPFKLDTYASNRWMIKPGDMVSDYLVRDFRNSGLFKAVFSFRDMEDAHFILEGSVDEFLEIDDGGKRTAAMTLSVTVLDVSRAGLTNRLLFQKKYYAAEPLPEKSPTGLAQAMSNGMKKLSTMIINDLYLAAQTPPANGR